MMTALFFFSNVSLERFDGLPNLIIYPNPANNLLNIKTDAQFDKVDIADLMGRIVQSFVISNSIEKIDISSMPAGLYYIKLHSDNQIVQRKFTKK